MKATNLPEKVVISGTDINVVFNTKSQGILSCKSLQMKSVLETLIVNNNKNTVFCCCGFQIIV